MKGIARATLVGNLTRDPELKKLGNDNAVCNLGMAVNQSAKVNGEWTDKPHFFEVVVWGKQAEIVAKYLSKGSQVAVTGHLEMEQWSDKTTGDKRSKIVVVAEQVVFLGGKKDEQKDDAPW